MFDELKPQRPYSTENGAIERGRGWQLPKWRIPKKKESSPTALPLLRVRSIFSTPWTPLIRWFAPNSALFLQNAIDGNLGGNILSCIRLPATRQPHLQHRKWQKTFPMPLHHSEIGILREQTARHDSNQTKQISSKESELFMFQTGKYNR